ncbi:MAG: hypothetical protein IT486_12340 [Gammaproteobacteria bacterium]|nr:hypothetical protein [Gammaproteobacteria bacterium]
MPRKPSASNKPPPREPESDVAEVPETEAEPEPETEAEAAPAAATTDNVGDISVEVNVEDLIAQIESESKTGAAADGSARRKIEDILEEKRVARETMDLEDFDIGD